MIPNTHEAIAQLSRAVVAKLTEAGASAAIIVYCYHDEDPGDPQNEVIEIVSSGETRNLQRALILDLIEETNPGGGYVRAKFSPSPKHFKNQ